MTRPPSALHQVQQSFAKLPETVCRSCAVLSQRIVELRSELMVAKLEAQRLREEKLALQAATQSERTPHRASKKKRGVAA